MFLALSVLLALPGPFLVGVTYLPDHPDVPSWVLWIMLALSSAVWLRVLGTWLNQRDRSAVAPSTGQESAPRERSVWELHDQATALENKRLQERLNRIPGLLWLLTAGNAILAVPTFLLAMGQRKGELAVMNGRFYAVNHGILIPLSSSEYHRQIHLQEQARPSAVAIFLMITAIATFVTLRAAPSSATAVSRD